MKESVLSLKEKQQHNFDFHSFKLPRVHSSMTHYILFLTSSEYDY